MDHLGLPTLNDVARRAGVSISTVSRYLNGIKIKEDLALKVEEAVKHLDYRPNYAARAVRGSKSSAIGMILPKIEHPYFSAVLEGATEEARRHDQTILVSSSQGKRAVENDIIHQFARSMIDGLIYTPVATDDDFIETESFRNLPVVIAARGPKVYPEFTHVYQNTRSGGYLSTNYLLSLGHRRIAFFASFWEPFCESSALRENLDHPGAEVYSSLDRFRGYLDALAEAGVDYNPDLAVVCGYGFDSGGRGVKELLSRCEPFDAIVTASDTVAGGVMHVLEMQGIEIPADVSVVGYGNLEVGTLMKPPLTTIQQDMFALGEASVRAVNRLIEDEPAANEMLDVKLIVRDSTRKKQTEHIHGSKHYKKSIV